MTSSVPWGVRPGADTGGGVAPDRAPEARKRVSDVAAFVASAQADPAFADALQHHEILASRPPAFALGLPSGFEPLAPVLAQRSIEHLDGHQMRAS